jgi:hypothetical protein
MIKSLLTLFRDASKAGEGRHGRTCLFVPEQGNLFLAVPHRDRQQAEIRVYKIQP